jgi:hypothetical protein
VAGYYGFAGEYVRESCSGVWEVGWRGREATEEVLVLKCGSDFGCAEAVENEKKRRCPNSVVKVSFKADFGCLKITALEKLE